jgi:hypothetical protein
MDVIVTLFYSTNDRSFPMTKTRNTLLMSTAAIALIAGIGLAFAQAPAPDARPSAPAAEKTAPVTAPKGAANSQAPEATTKTGQADVKVDRKGAKAQSAQDNNKDGMMSKDGMTHRGGMMSKGSNADANAEPKPQDRSRTGANADSRTNTNARGSERTMEKTGDAKFGAKDRASAGRSDNLSGEQRSSIRTVITHQNVQPMTNVTFALSVGTQVPRTAHFNRVPAELVAIYPRWRGFDYVLVGDQILVINPRSHKIVAILDA